MNGSYNFTSKMVNYHLPSADLFAFRSWYWNTTIQYYQCLQFIFYLHLIRQNANYVNRPFYHECVEPPIRTWFSLVVRVELNRQLARLRPFRLKLISTFVLPQREDLREWFVLGLRRKHTSPINEQHFVKVDSLQARYKAKCPSLLITFPFPFFNHWTIQMTCFHGN